MDSYVDSFINDVIAGLADETPSAGSFAEARQKAREGDPMPLAHLQWPGAVWDEFQEDLVVKFFDPEIWACAVKGSTGCGKGATAARILCLYYDVFRDAKIILTSVSHEHCLTTLFNEVKLWFNRMSSRPPGLVGAMNIKDGEEHFILPVNPANETAFAGKHSQGGHTVFAFDEACHDDKTEVLTRSGWKYFKDLDGSEEFMSMDIHTEKVRYIKATHLHKSFYRGDMYLREGNGSNFCVTPNHRMIYESRKGIRELREIKDFPRVFQSKIRQSIHWEASKKETYILPELVGPNKTWPEQKFDMDDWLEFMGWYLSEGSIGFTDGIPYSVAITQNRGPKFDRIFALLTRLGFKPHKKQNGNQLIIGSRQLAEHLINLAGRGCLAKKIPDFIGECSATQIAIFLKAYRDGDGYCRKNRDILYTSSKEMADGLQILALKTGKRCSVVKRKLAGRQSNFGTHIATSSVDGYVLNIPHKDHRLSFCLNKISTIQYEGMVYCATLPVNGTLLTRRNGRVLWSGNSAVLPDRWDNMQDQANKAIVLSNPRIATCRFRAMFPSVDPDKTQIILHSRGKIFCQTISATDMCNYKKQCLSKPIGPLGGVTIEGKFFEHGEKIPSEYHRKRLPVIPGQRCYDEVQADLAAKDKRRVEWQVHAKFPKSDEDVQTILPEWRARSDDAWIAVHETLPVWVFGLDIAASADGDSTQLAAGGILGCKGLHGTQKADTTDTVAWVYKIAQEHYGIDLRRQGVVVGDAVGVGKGPLDLLASQGVDVLFLYGSGRPIIEESAHRFKNIRAEMYGLLGDRLNPDGAAHHETAFPIPPDELLWEELCAAEKIYDSMGKFKLTPKTESVIDQGSGRKIESIKDKIGRSPDRADAVAMMYLGALYKETEGGVVINRPLLVLPDDFVKKPKDEKKPTMYNPNMPLWMNPTSVEIADILEKQQKALRESEIATVDK